jgi:hypothetical protein
VCVDWGHCNAQDKENADRWGGVGQAVPAQIVYGASNRACNSTSVCRLGHCNAQDKENAGRCDVCRLCTGCASTEGLWELPSWLSLGACVRLDSFCLCALVTVCVIRVCARWTHQYSNTSWTHQYSNTALAVVHDAVCTHSTHGLAAPAPQINYKRVFKYRTPNTAGACRYPWGWYKGKLDTYDPMTGMFTVGGWWGWGV